MITHLNFLLPVTVPPINETNYWWMRRSHEPLSAKRVRQQEGYLVKMH
jgi:hypothetical protein